MPIADGQFDLDGYLFGTGQAVGVRSVDRGESTTRHQDQAIPSRSGRLMGQDVEDSPEWLFELMGRAGGREAVKAALRAVSAAWRRPYSVGEMSVLRWRDGDDVRRVYGRARGFRDFTHPHILDAGRAPAMGAFQLADPLIYDDEASVLDLGLTALPGEGVTLPAVLPWVLGGRPGRRDGEVHVAGAAPVPFELTFHGPSAGTASGWWAQGAGWRVDLDAELAWDQSVTVDTRTSTVTRNDGLSLAGAARGRFLTARLAPGQQEISWGVNDPTGTARMTLTHRPGHYSL